MIEYCSDSDNENGKIALTEQSFIEGNVIYSIDNCGGNWSAGCFVAISSADVCSNNATLIEQTCYGNKISSKEILCNKGCIGGRCLDLVSGALGG